MEHPEFSRLLQNLTLGSIVVGDYEQASRLIDEQELIGRQLRQRATRPIVATNRGMLAHYRGDLHTAEQLLLEGLGEWRRLNRIGEFDESLRELAQVSLAAGAFEQAAKWASELIDLGHRMLMARIVADGHVLLARAELGRRDIQSATDAGEEALQIALDSDDTWALALLAAASAQIAWTTGDPTGAATLHAAAEAMRTRIGFALPKHRGRELEHEYLLLRQALGSDGFHDAWHHGAAADRTQLVGTIRRVLASIGT